MNMQENFHTSHKVFKRLHDKIRTRDRFSNNESQEEYLISRCHYRIPCLIKLMACVPAEHRVCRCSLIQSLSALVKAFCGYVSLQGRFESQRSRCECLSWRPCSIKGYVVSYERREK